MTYQMTSHDRAPTLRSTGPGLFSRVASRILGGFVAIGERSELAARARLAHKLDKMTDAELASVGIRRDGIMRFAFGAYVTI